MIITETVYKDRNNTNDFKLKQDDQISDLTSVTKIQLITDKGTIDSSDELYSNIFDWTTNPTEGILRIKTSQIDLFEIGESIESELIIFDPGNTSGVNYGKIIFNIK